MTYSLAFSVMEHSLPHRLVGLSLRGGFIKDKNPRSLLCYLGGFFHVVFMFKGINQASVHTEARMHSSTHFFMKLYMHKLKKLDRWTDRRTGRQITKRQMDIYTEY